MAANFQQMGGPGQMMNQQRQQQQQRGQTNASAQIQQMIFSTLNAQTGPLEGWQAAVLPTERMGLIFSIIGNLRLASQHQQNPPNLQRMIEIGLRFEKDIFDKSENKDAYKSGIDAKLTELLERRNQNQAALQQQINQQAQNQALMQQQSAQQQSQNQMMMNQNNLGGQGPRPMPQQHNQQGFQHLQHQMTASPLPGQQIQQAPMGMQNQGMPQGLTPNQQQQFQMALHQRAQQQQNLPGRPGGQMPHHQLSPQDNNMVMEVTHKLMAQASEEEKANLRATVMLRLDPEQTQKYAAQGVDPLFMYYRSQALARFRQEKAARMTQAQQQLAMGQVPQNMPPSAPAMQQQRPINPSPLTGQTQPPVSMGGNPDFGSFMGNMENVAAQQQQGVMAEQAGQMVVPASGAPRNATPQPGSMPGQAPNMNQQGNAGNLNPQQRQQLMHAQQMQQQQRLTQSIQQQQSQVQARMNAQKNAQQMGLQGQPGGMGPGPVPPQQSPAMATLNAPLRTPSQPMNHPDGLQGNTRAGFGTPLDPRFMQGNQRQAGLPDVTQAFVNSLTPENQQRLAGMAPDKLSEIATKWNEQRSLNIANMQNMRPGMGMQGISQGRLGQSMPQAGPFNSQNGANQFMNPNGQRAPVSMAANMNPAQQQLLQQQMNNLRPGQIQRPPVQIQADSQRIAVQMDDALVPQPLMAHALMPQNVPFNEIKKWGQLKQWTANNPNLPPSSIDSVKQLQTLHYRQILAQRARQQQQQMAAAGMQPGLQIGQPGNPTVQPGMAAPVAPMGTNPMQMPNAMGMGAFQPRQPTQLEIQQIRNHSSGKMLQATDDQIRMIYNKSIQSNQQAQMTPQQMHHRQQMQQMQIQQRLQQANAQGHQPGQPQSQANANMNAQAHTKPPSMPPSKPAPQVPEQPSATNNSNIARNNARPQTANKNQGQNSSPAQPAKNLKRASSDDVVEVPNPNAQPARPQPAPATAPNQTPQMPRAPLLTAAQIAQLDPEKRKRYEQMLKVTQQQKSANRAMQIDPIVAARLEAIRREEQENSRDPHSKIEMDEQAKQLTAQSIRGIMNHLNNVNKILGRWFQVIRNEEQARQYCRFRTRISKQFQDEAMTVLKDSFSITIQEIGAGRTVMNAMLSDLSAKFPNMMVKKEDGAKPQPAAVSQPTQQPQPPPTPLNAANLQQQQQQLNKMHQRSNSRSSAVPAAPTDSRPPFQFGASSPHGAPAYIGGNQLTQENLKIPARKRQKQNGTPGSTASPQVSKAASPEMKRQGQSSGQVKKEFTCSEPDCDRHIQGFESAKELDKHNQDEHIRPLQDPMKYAQENLANMLGLDASGQPKQTETSTPMVQNGSKQGQTPNVKNETPSASATPMNRQVSMNRQASATDGKPTVAKTNLAKDASVKLQSMQNEAKAPAQQEQAQTDLWANATIDPHDLLQTFKPLETGAGGAISDMDTYRSITSNNTPESSKDGISEPNSDISDGVGLDINIDISTMFDDNWRPFGGSDMDALFNTDGFNVSGEDVTMADDEPRQTWGSWDDMVDQSAFDKPFVFDPSLYSMKAD